MRVHDGRRSTQANMYKPKSNTYVKIVLEPEMRITKLASENGIAPKLVEPIDQKGYVYKLVMEAYPATLAKLDSATDRCMWAVFEDEIKDKVKALHSLGYIHGDLHQHNIVINPESGEVRLIDFGESRPFDDPSVSKIYSDKVGPLIESPEDVYKRELYEVERRARSYHDRYMQNNRPGTCKACCRETVLQPCEGCPTLAYCYVCHIQKGHYS